MQLSLTPGALYFQVRGDADGREGCARARGEIRGEASCISRELGCNNYYLSRPLAHHPLLRSCAHHYISSRHSTSAGVFQSIAAATATAVLCFANRIDFRNLSRGRFSLCPLVHGRPNRNERRYIVIALARVRSYAFSGLTAYNKFSTNNKSAW